MIRQVRSVLLMLGLLLAVSVHAAENAPAEDAKKQAAVDALFAEYDHATTPGLAVGIYQGGRQVYAKGYGMANLENAAVITPDTVFHVASVSKQFTAFSILLLAREGKVKLDEDIRTYLPFVPDFGHKITVRHLLYHTSGLRDQWSLFELGGVESDSRRRQSQIVNMVSRQRALNAPPGTEYNYCNTGYTLLAEIVRAVSGQTLRQFSTERIFKPLQMQRMFFFDDVTEIVPLRAQSYDKTPAGKWFRRIMTIDTAGATSLHATVGDFAKWAGNFTRPVVGDKALIEQFTTMGKLDDGTPINYGFALLRGDVLGHQVIMHNGSDAGFRSIFSYFPDEDFSVAVLSNTPVDVSKAMERVVDVYLGRKAGTSAPKIPAATPASTLAEGLPGKYQDISGSILSFVTVDGKVALDRERSKTTVPVVFRADDTFDLGDEPRTAGRFYRLARGAKNVVTGIEAVSDGTATRLRRVTPVDPAKVNLRELVGDYRSAELDATYSLVLRDKQLFAESIWFNEPIPLKPEVKDGFSTPLVNIAIKRDGQGRPAALLLSSGRMRNVQFDRVK